MRIGFGRKRPVKAKVDQGEPVGDETLPVEDSEAIGDLVPAAEQDASPAATPRRKLKVAIAS